MGKPGDGGLLGAQLTEVLKAAGTGVREGVGPEVTSREQEHQRHQIFSWNGLTVGDGECGPLNGLPHLLAISKCVQLDSAKVRRLVLLPQVLDAEEAGVPTLCPVQAEPVPEILMSE